MRSVGAGGCDTENGSSGFDGGYDHTFPMSEVPRYGLCDIAGVAMGRRGRRAALALRGRRASRTGPASGFACQHLSRALRADPIGCFFRLNAWSAGYWAVSELSVSVSLEVASTRSLAGPAFRATLSPPRTV